MKARISPVRRLGGFFHRHRGTPPRPQQDLMTMLSRRNTLYAALALAATVGIAPLARAQAPSLDDIPPYKKEIECDGGGGLRLFGNWMRGNMIKLVDAFNKVHPECKASANFMTSSEGGIAALYIGVADLAPMGDDAKITDMMPFYEAYKYVPSEISIATGGFEGRGTLWPAVFLVNKDNPLTKLTMDQLSRIFGASRTGGWDIGAQASNGLRYTSKYARGPEQNIRTWDQLGLTGAEFKGKPIQTYGYVSPGFKIYLERRLNHWSQKWNENYKEYVETQQATKDDAGFKIASERMLEELSKDKYGMGWSAWLHAKDYPNLRPLAIAAKEGGPYVAYTPDNVANRSYPLVRDYYMYYRRPPGGKVEPKVREFLRFCLSREGQKVIADHGQFTPMPAAYIAEQLKKLD
jgi:phosphate transport system substrate-binding protein